MSGGFWRTLVTATDGASERVEGANMFMAWRSTLLWIMLVVGLGFAYAGTRGATIVRKATKGRKQILLRLSARLKKRSSAAAPLIPPPTTTGTRVFRSLWRQPRLRIATTTNRTATIREQAEELSTTIATMAADYETSGWWKGWIAVFINLSVGLSGAILAMETLLVMFFPTWKILVMRFLLSVYITVASMFDQIFQLTKNCIIEWNLWIALDRLHREIELELASSHSDAELRDLYLQWLGAYNTLMADESLSM